MALFAVRSNMKIKKEQFMNVGKYRNNVNIASLNIYNIKQIIIMVDSNG